MLTAADFPVSPRRMERQLKVLQATYFRNPQEQNPEVVYIAGQPAPGNRPLLRAYAVVIRFSTQTNYVNFTQL